MTQEFVDRVTLCQSACGPCEKLCDTCRDAPAKYAERVLREETEKAIRLLKSQGYTVEKKI